MEKIRSFPGFRFQGVPKAAVLTLLFFVFGASVSGLCPCSHAAEQAPAVTKAAPQGHDCCPKTESRDTAKDCSADDCLHHRVVTVDSRTEFVIPSVFSYQPGTAPAVSETSLFLESLRAFSFQTVPGQGAQPEPLYVLFRSLLI